MALFDSIVAGSTAAAFLTTVALAFVVPKLRQAAKRKDPSSALVEGLTPFIPDDLPNLPVRHNDPDWRECVAVSQAIADLMIADEWFEIADKIADWEAVLASTPGGERYHEIAIKTCLSGLQGLIDDAPRNDLSDLDDAEVEVGHFVDSHRQTPDNHVLALLAARAHVALGEVFEVDDWPETMRREVLRRRAKHFIAAGNILAEFDAVAHMSPLLAEAHYLQALGSPGGDHMLEALFREWIDLDPSNSEIYNTHVAALVARDMLTGDDILQEAEAAMRRTEKTLGFGGYALFFTPLLTEYDAARGLLDPELYAAALMDLASNSATQAEVNLAAATLLTEMESSDVTTSAAYRDTLILMIRRHMKEIHPRVWPISAEEVQELAIEAAYVIPDDGMDAPPVFTTDRPETIAA